jgi:hypothetical protein
LRQPGEWLLLISFRQVRRRRSDRARGPNARPPVRVRGRLPHVRDRDYLAEGDYRAALRRELEAMVATGTARHRRRRGRSSSWTRRVVAVAPVAAIVVVFFVPLPHASLFHGIVAPARVTIPAAHSRRPSRFQSSTCRRHRPGGRRSRTETCRYRCPRRGRSSMREVTGVTSPVVPARCTSRRQRNRCRPAPRTLPMPSLFGP